MSSDSYYICPDLLFTILKFFPVQSLLRCRLVCKSWKQVIDSTPFKLDHLSVQRRRILVRNNKREYVLLDAVDNRNLLDTVRGPEDGEKFLGRAVITANGVVCRPDGSNGFVLWNPSIRRQLWIHGPQIRKKFDCSKLYNGFWIDPLTKEFKVVLFCFKGKGIALYSSRKKEWVEIAMDPDLIADYCKSAQVLIDRVAHWIATTTSNGIYAIVWFDYGRDKFGTMDLPIVRRKSPSWGAHVNVSKWQGLLSIVLSEQTYHSMLHHVYVLRNGSWSRQATVLMSILISEVVHVGDLGRMVVAFTNYGDLVLCDPENDDMLMLYIDKHRVDYGVKCCYYLAYDFVESLVFPDESW